jgi:hypothetical protein
LIAVTTNSSAIAQIASHVSPAVATEAAIATAIKVARLALAAVLRHAQKVADLLVRWTSGLILTPISSELPTASICVRS